MKTIILFFILTGTLVAGGSEGFDHIKPMIQKNSKMALLLKRYDFNNAIWADVRLGNHTKLGGLRLGPYTCKVKAKGSKKWTHEAKFMTTYEFYDAKGNEVDVLSPNLETCKEKIISVKITKLEE